MKVRIMEVLKRSVSSRLWIIFTIVVIAACQPMRIPTIHDGVKLGCTPLDCTDQSQPLPRTADIYLPKFADWAGAKALDKFKNIDDLIDGSNTTAFIVVQDGKLVYERYANGVSLGDITQVFSVTKVFVTSMLSIALKDGYIKSLDQPVSDFLPEFAEAPYDQITLFHLAQMQSGLHYDEYGKLLQTLRFYYDKDLKRTIRGQPAVKHEAGSVYTYKSIDTQILGECIEKAIGRPFMEYFHEKLWSQLYPEDSTKWSTDRPQNGELKYYGGLNASARDLAKFGVMVANDGNYKGKQIMDKGLLNICDDRLCRNGENTYCYGWWYGECDETYNVYFGAGFNGQILFINESTNTVIVRLGKNKGGLVWYPMLKNLSIEMARVNHITVNGTELALEGEEISVSGKRSAK